MKSPAEIADTETGGFRAEFAQDLERFADCGDFIAAVRPAVSVHHG
jgi:hypothetical protein